MNGRETNRGKRIAAVLAACAATVLEVAVICVLTASWREMHHEGLTYSQWYEDSIYGFYSMLRIALVITGIWAAACLHMLSVFRGRSWAFPERGRRICAVLCAVFAVLSAAMLVLALIRQGAVRQAVAERAEMLEGYIRAYGGSLTAALAFLEAAAAAWLGWRKK